MHYARIVRVSLAPESVTEAVDYFRDTVTPALKEHTGFVYSRMLVEPSDNHCLMISVWETEEARTGAETSGLLSDVLKHLREYFASKPVVNYYEVSV